MEYPILSTLRPELRWEYEGTCAPDAFQVEVAPNGDFDSPETLTATTDGPDASWAPSIDLQPATRYEWRVAARSGDLVGPLSVAQTFFTGPVCTGADLQPPLLVSPAQEAIVADASSALEWASAVAGCLQESYNFELAVDPAFSAPALSGDAGPWTSFDTEVDYLEDCTPYFWRVRSVYGMDMSSPYSTVGIFYTDFLGTCPAHGALPRVSGFVWDDQCESAGVIPGQAPAPPGCVYREGGYGADGVRQAGEPGIAGLVVRYGTGGCPARGQSDAVWEPTDADGSYWQVLMPGEYCLWLDSAGDGNDEVLGDGLSTYPPGGYDAPSNYEITLDWGDVIEGLDFGWDAR
jgi:hypothetical protein